VPTEAEVVPDDERAGTETPLQQLHEFGPRHGPQALAETHQQERAQPGSLEQPPALTKVGEPRGRIRWMQELARHRLEAEHQRGTRARAREPQRLADQGTVALVQAVERTEGGYATPVVLAQVVRAANELHVRAGKIRNR
jgi:hypothetical protein